MFKDLTKAYLEWGVKASKYWSSYAFLVPYGDYMYFTIADALFVGNENDGDDYWNLYNAVHNKENINIAWAPDGKTIAVGNKEDLVTFIDAKSHKIVREEQFKFEVNEISWSRPSDLLFLTNGQVRKS